MTASLPVTEGIEEAEREKKAKIRGCTSFPLWEVAEHSKMLSKQPFSCWKRKSSGTAVGRRKPCTCEETLTHREHVRLRGSRHNPWSGKQKSQKKYYGWKVFWSKNGNYYYAVITKKYFHRAFLTEAWTSAKPCTALYVAARRSRVDSFRVAQKQCSAIKS